MEEAVFLLDAIDRVGLSLAIVVVILIALWRLTPTIKRYIETIISAKEQRAQHDGELNELLRMSTKVIENNTETLKIVNHYNHHAEDLITAHDKDSAERQRRIEAHVLGVANDLDKVITGIEIIKQKG